MKVDLFQSFYNNSSIKKCRYCGGKGVIIL